MAPPWLNARAPAAAVASPPKAWLRLGALAAALALTGCAVGPNFKPPTARASDSYAAQLPRKTVATPHLAAGDAQHFERTAALPADWWTAFHSAPLNALIEQALANNHDLKAAQAALTVAHETTLSGRGA